MKRYLLFCGYQYYPSGGWEDFAGSYDSIREAILSIIDIHFDWYHIVDTETMDIIDIEDELWS